MSDILLVEKIVNAIMPAVSTVAWFIVVWRNLRYRKKIKELEEFKDRVEILVSKYALDL